MRRLCLVSVVALAAVAGPDVRPAAASTHDCAILYMGAGGSFFASALRHQAENFRIANPQAKRVEVRVHWDARPVPAECKNPLLVGHSMGAIRAVKIGNAAGRGRVISIDPPNWYTRAWGLKSLRPAVNFFHCPPSPFGCGKVTGNVRNVDLSKERRRHVGLPYSRRITAEVLK